MIKQAPTSIRGAVNLNRPYGGGCKRVVVELGEKKGASRSAGSSTAMQLGQAYYGSRWAGICLAVGLQQSQWANASNVSRERK